jgi:hypothetical protein
VAAPAATGYAGGIYGIDGAILSSILIGSGRPAAEVARPPCLDLR